MDGTGLAGVGAGVPANTGAAGAKHRVACFAGKPAPTMNRAGFSNFEKDSCSYIGSVSCKRGFTREAGGAVAVLGRRAASGNLRRYRKA